MRKLSGSYVTIGVHEGAGRYNPEKYLNLKEQRRLRKLDRLAAKVGAVREKPEGPRVVDVALWNEYGTRYIPERSFIRATIVENMGLLDNWRQAVLQKIMVGRATPYKGLSIIGMRVRLLIQNKIKSNISPENAPRTLARKRALKYGDRTLIMTGLLLRSITYAITLGKNAASADKTDSRGHHIEPEEEE